MVISLRLRRATSPVTTATPPWRSASEVLQEISASCRAVTHTNARNAQAVQLKDAKEAEMLKSSMVRP